MTRLTILYIGVITLGVLPSDAGAQFDREWKIFVVPFSHVDVGFTAPVPQVVEQQSAYLDSAIAYVERTASNPPESRFKWSSEITWPLEDYLASRAQQEIDRLMEHVRAGSIEINAMHFGLQTDLTAPEELVRSLYFSHRLAREYGFDIRTAVTNDTPGFTWGLAQLLEKAEIPYFSVAMNSFLSDFYQTTNLPNLFYWEGQSGHRTLVWRSIHDTWAYLEGIVWGVYDAYGIMEFRLTNLLNAMADNGYPYDFVLINGATGDNGAPIISISNNAREWNIRHSDSQMRVATFSEFFDYAASAGVEIPVFKGDAPNWWSWSFAASATGGYLRSREAQVLLPAAEAAAAIGSALEPSFSYPRAALRRAYVNNLLFEDHNLGAASNRPFDENIDFWERKMGWVNAAADTARSVKRRALDAWSSAIDASDPLSVVVFNLTPWERTDIARITASQLIEAGLGLVRIFDGESAAEITGQFLHSGDLVFIAEDVPAFGFRRYRLESLAGLPTPRSLSAPALDNDLLHVEIDPATGGLTSLYDKELDVELASGDGRFGLYLLNGSGVPQTAIVESDSGAVLQRLVLNGTAPASDSYRTEILLPGHEKRVDILATWDKSPISGLENVDFRFDFAFPDATLNYEIPFGNVRVFTDELEGFQSNHYGWLRWSEIGSAEATVVLATTGAGVHAYSSGSFQGDVRLLTSFNNDHTAYRAGIGELQSGFSITTRGPGTDPAASTQFAYRYNLPLETRIVTEHTGLIDSPVYSFVGFEGSDVFVSTFKRAEDGNGFILRVFNPSAEAAQTRVEFDPEVQFVAETNLLERDLRALGRSEGELPLDLGPYEVRTLRFVLSVPSSTERNPGTAVSLGVDPPYPNPATDRTHIELDLSAPGRVRVAVFDVLGREIDTVSDRPERPGRKTLTWRPPSDLAAGVYLISVQATLPNGRVLTGAQTAIVSR